MSKYVWGEGDTQFFFHLDPHTVLEAVEKLGFRTTGRCLTLNSMENRVYEVEIERSDEESQNPSDHFVIAKFYRPGRWSREQILEEHQFLLDAFEAEVPVIPPIVIDGETLFRLDDHQLFYTLFPKKGGRAPDELSDEQLEIMGRMIARLHNVGTQRKAKHRLAINPTTFGRQNLKFLLDKQMVPPHFEKSYKDTVEKICELIDPLFAGIPTQRIHGDLHLGNVIWREGEGAFLIDFDDMLVGPAVQDIWPMIPGDDPESLRQRSILLDSYQSMRDFDYSTLKLIEPLRALRFIHFSAWISKRWEDPAFKQAFVHFGTDHYWSGQLTDLQTQLMKIQQINSFLFEG